MATTIFNTGDNLVRQAWDARLIEETIDDVYWDRFMGEGPNNVIKVMRELQRNKGETITYGLVETLDGVGVLGDSTLKGSEEAVTYADDSVTLQQYRHAVKLDGRLTEQRVNFNMRDHARSRLAMWLAERIDNVIFDALEASPTTTLFGGDATSTATVDSADKLDPELIQRLKTTALLADPRIRPVRVRAEDYFLLVVHPGAAFDLKRDSEWQQNSREARERGLENPIFMGALDIIDGVIIHTHPRVGTASTWGAGGAEPGATNSFCGREVGVMAWGRPPEMVETEEDYGNQYAIGAGAIFGFNKSVFNAADYAYIGANTYRTNL